jgi:hypothetical protein
MLELIEGAWMLEEISRADAASNEVVCDFDEATIPTCPVLGVCHLLVGDDFFDGQIADLVGIEFDAVQGIDFIFCVNFRKVAESC